MLCILDVLIYEINLMAKQTGLIDLKGTLGGLSFYSSVFGNLVRRKGGPSKALIKKHPNFKSMREHHAEFANCAMAGKLFRQSLKVFTVQAPDYSLVWRVTQVMNQIKDLDLSSKRGKRSVAKGIKSLAGQALLKNFELNSKAPLKKILKRNYTVENNNLKIMALVPKRDLLAPKGASHVKFSFIVLRIDFENKTAVAETKTVELALSKNPVDVLLKPAIPKGSGQLIFMLQLKFEQAVNGKQYLLEDKTGNSMSVLELK